MRRDVGHRYGIVVVVGDVESVLGDRGEEVLGSGNRMQLVILFFKKLHCFSLVICKSLGLPPTKDCLGQPIVY